MKNNEIVKTTKVINLFAGPGAGKSTSTWEIASALKLKGLNAEVVSEYAKELVYDENFQLLDGSLKSQKAILTEQRKRIDRLIGKVDVIVTDAPLLLNSIYLAQSDIEYYKNVLDIYNSYDNINVFVNRTNMKYETRGRTQSLDESMLLDTKIKNLLLDNNLEYFSCNKFTAKDIVNKLNLNQGDINMEITILKKICKDYER